MLEVLVSTMNLEDYSKLIEKMNIKGKSVIINQITKENIKDINMKNEKTKVLSYREKGLSKSRNKAISASTEDICIIADDDLKYVDDYEKIIVEAYIKYKDADMIAFYVENEDKTRPITQQEEGKIGFLKSMKISSVQITFKRQSIVNANIKFEEEFGAGSGKYCMGEENIFLNDCLNKKLNIYYVPITIATLENKESSWFKGFNKEYFISKGAMFTRMSSHFSLVLILQFAIRKYKLYKEEMNMKDAIQYMLQGKKQLGNSMQKCERN